MVLRPTYAGDGSDYPSLYAELLSDPERESRIATEQDDGTFIRLDLRHHTVRRREYLIRCCQRCWCEVEREEEYEKSVFLLAGEFFWTVTHIQCVHVYSN